MALHFTIWRSEDRPTFLISMLTETQNSQSRGHTRYCSYDNILDINDVAASVLRGSCVSLKSVRFGIE
eukprot:scaffold4870_cov135-Cylindrotheca_fusiformis.AAC.4